MLTLLLATRNPGKVAELQHALLGLPVRIRTLADVPEAPVIDEDQPTLEGNARKKAVTLFERTGWPTLADDTGLEVEALGGKPGVHSARYAGPDADDAANRRRLLEALSEASDRRAQFRTVLAFVEAGGGVRLFEGTCAGTIRTAERGTNGFGYDALFQPDGDTRTFAEYTKAEKNAVSHRGRALRTFEHYLRQEWTAEAP